MGRPSKCGGCGECVRCRRAAYMRDWWSRQPPEKKRAVLDARRERHGEQLREADRKRYREQGPRSQPDPAKHAARRAVHAAIRSGDLTRLPCETCGDVQTDAHHDDYTKPLDVRWLCRKHHGEAHRVYSIGEAA